MITQGRPNSKHRPKETCFASDRPAAIVLPVNPSLYQINTKVLLSSLGKGSTLDTIPNSLLDSLASQGFDWVWLLGVWEIGASGRQISVSHKDWHDEYRHALPDLSTEDICGSPFAVCGYTVDPSLGGDPALARFRERLEQRGLELLLDFVPNHIGFDHPWVANRPDFLIKGTDADIEKDPSRWTRLPSGEIFAFGRDPHFPGWPDTLQLNYFNPQLRSAMVGELKSIAARCSGVRCDMAMLLEPEVFAETWGEIVKPKEAVPRFWPEAISAVKRDNPRFMFLAEVYWGYEQRLQDHGFDFTYDKVLYDRLMHHEATKVREHLSAPLPYQQHMARFLENHDEPRVSSRLSDDEHRAAVTIMALAPGLRFFHHGQFKGSKIKVPVHLNRGPNEVANPSLVSFYQKLIPIVNSQVGKRGDWHLIHCSPAWEGNSTNTNFIAYLLQYEDERVLVAVNYAPYQGQCHAHLPRHLLPQGPWILEDKLSGMTYTRDAGDMCSKGLYLDEAGFSTLIFALRPA